MHKVYLSIGTNIGNRKDNVRQALCDLSKISEITALSKAYRTKPYGVLEQPDFINMAISINTKLSPQNLLMELHKIENRLGRVRKTHWGERTIDLDILFFDQIILESEDLIIPHPDLQNRLFVLKPLLNIAPELVHPKLQKNIQNLFDLAFHNN